MGKLLSILLVLAVLVQLVRPLGLPGLERRADAWKIAIGAILLFGLAVFIRPE
ncbi:hypothetical protein [Aureimonas leprariae]|uniref:hypothetical protein n=1 Tax=Plantimonas leprariae TaxID=2615207 RepID=UPI00192A3B8B|nr:hypothetical protein [Aureimonas leprariae]